MIREIVALAEQLARRFALKFSRLYGAQKKRPQLFWAQAGTADGGSGVRDLARHLS